MNGCIRPITNYQDFEPVFRTFESFPYFEIWENNQIQDVYQIAKQNGYLYGYYNDDSHCVGIISATITNSDTLLLTDLAVLPQYRNNGIGTQLLKHMLNVAKTDNFKIVCFRYSNSNPMILGIAKKMGFTKSHDKCNIVHHPRHCNIHIRTHEDLRFFMCKNL